MSGHGKNKEQLPPWKYVITKDAFQIEWMDFMPKTKKIWFQSNYYIAFSRIYDKIFLWKVLSSGI
jgi:hypothetical protein